MQWAKARGVPLLIAGHVTKDGTLAGPRVLEHMVDVVLYMEGESVSQYRLLRSTKNRFGSTNEVGVFQMGDRGMEEVADPSQALLSERRQDAVGSVIVPTLEGSRPLMVEVQALTTPSMLPAPRRTANGVDFNRLLMVAAVLSQRAGLPLGGQDILVNVVGGLTVNEPACDLAVALAIASSFKNSPLPPDLVALGELSLTGDLRSAPQVERRLREAARLGFARCLAPPSSGREGRSAEGVRVVPATTLRQALRLAFGSPATAQDEAIDPRSA
jgi:DNA repair protein RadA/Sms